MELFRGGTKQHIRGGLLVAVGVLGGKGVVGCSPGGDVIEKLILFCPGTQRALRSANTLTPSWIAWRQRKEFIARGYDIVENLTVIRAAYSDMRDEIASAVGGGINRGIG